MTFLKITMLLIIVLQFILVPSYMKAAWPEKSKKSLILKMICATLFFIFGILLMIYAKNYTVYAYLVLLALAFSWVGDFFLHVNDKKSSFLIGLSSFLLGHIFYISAFSTILIREYKQPFFFLWEFIVLAVCIPLGYGVGLLGKVSTGKMKLPVMIYLSIILTMIIKAIRLSITLFNVDAPGATSVAILLIVGALLFAISDAVLAFMLFSDKKGFTARVLNSSTYFGAQMLLASTILFLPL